MSQNSLEPSEDIQLIQRIQKLPLELRNQIEEATYESAFSGGFSYLHGAFNGASGGEKMPPPNARLLTVDKYVYTKYKEWLWKENTLVVDLARASKFYSPGQSICAVGEILGHRHFRKVHVNFSTRPLFVDFGVSWPPERPIEPPPPRHRQHELFWHWPGMVSFGDMLLRVRFYLDILPPTTLEELTLDFTECYRFNGKWQGYKAMAELCDFQPSGLWEGVHVNILAPSPEKERFLYYCWEHREVTRDAADYDKFYAEFTRLHQIAFCQ